MKVSGFVAIVFWSFLGMGQEVHVSQGNGNVVLSVWAQKPYELIPGETKMPVLTVDCVHKGKKIAHLLKFLPGGSVVEDNPDAGAQSGQLIFIMTIGGSKQMTTWMPYGDTVTYAYAGKTDAERLKFIQSVSSSGTVSIEFKPFLTGSPTTSTFDLSKLRDAMDKYPECATR
jgi:hypothetical protein